MGNILVVDDEPGVREVLADVVSTLGHRVRTAPDGREALDLFDRERFDCVITDLAMPEVDGLTVLRRVKRKSPSTGVLVLTGNSTMDLLVASVNMGADAYVTKPFKVSEIDEQLTRLLAAGARAGAEPAQPAPASTLSHALGFRVRILWALVSLAALVAAVLLLR